MKIKKIFAGVGVLLIIMSSNACADNYFLLVKAVGKITDDIASLKSKASLNEYKIRENKNTVYNNKKNIASLSAKNTIAEEKIKEIKQKIMKLTKALEDIKKQKDDTNQHDIKIIKDYINK